MAASISPQPMVVGEPNPTSNPQTSYSGLLNPKQAAQNMTKTQLKPIEYVHGEPTLKFTMEEREAFAIEEGLHQAIVIKLSSGAPDLRDLRTLLPKHLGIKGHCLIGSLAPRQLLLRCDQYDDYVIAFARSVNYFSYNGKEHQYRIFPWSIGFNHKEETTKAAVWISLPNLAPDLFAKRSLLSIAAAVGKPIAIDKATQVKSRPSTARVKVILDLLEKLPKRIRLQYLDNKTDKLLESVQEIVYDNLPLYCNSCKHQGHDEGTCRLILKKKLDTIQNEGGEACEEEATGEKFQGDLRELLNEKRGREDGDRRPQEKNQQTGLLKNSPPVPIDVEVQKNVAMLAASTVDSGQQQTVANKDATGDVDARELMVENSGQHSNLNVAEKLLDKKLEADPTQSEHVMQQFEQCMGANSGQNFNEKHDIVRQVENSINEEHATGDESIDKIKGVDNSNGKDWTMVAHKKYSGIRVGSPARGNVQQVRDIPCARASSPKDIARPNPFDLLSAEAGQEINPNSPTMLISNPEVAKALKENQQGDYGKQQGESTQLVSTIHKEQQGDTSSRCWADLVDKEDEHQADNIGSKLNAQAPIFVPNKSPICNSSSGCKQTSGDVLISLSPINTNTQPKQLVGIDTLSPKRFDNLQGDDIFEEEEDEESLDICFANAARDANISPRQQRNRKTKIYDGRNQSWDGKVTEEFVPRHLPMRLAKQNHMTVSTTFTRSNKFKK